MATLVRSISQNGGVICTAIDSTDIAAKAEQIHRTSATVTAALGRLLTAASLMGVMLKSQENSITIRLQGDGACRPFDRSYRRIRECPRRCGASGGGNSFKWKRKAGCGWCGGKKRQAFRSERFGDEGSIHWSGSQSFPVRLQRILPITMPSVSRRLLSVH